MNLPQALALEGRTRTPEEEAALCAFVREMGEALQSTVDALHLFMLATGSPSDIQTCNATLNAKPAYYGARQLIGGSDV